jgi:hypothetical protein
MDTVLRVAVLSFVHLFVHPMHVVSFVEMLIAHFVNLSLLFNRSTLAFVLTSCPEELHNKRPTVRPCASHSGFVLRLTKKQ